MGMNNLCGLFSKDGEAFCLCYFSWPESSFFALGRISAEIFHKKPYISCFVASIQVLRWGFSTSKFDTTKANFFSSHPNWLTSLLRYEPMQVLTLNDICQQLKIGKTTLWKLRQSPDFPKPLFNKNRYLSYDAEQVEQWYQRVIVARPQDKQE